MPTRLPFHQLLFLLIVLLLPLSAGCSRTSGLKQPEPTLVTTAQIRTLRAEESESELPVRLKGVATYFNKIRNTLVVQDGTGGIFVDTAQIGESYTPGKDVEIEGVTRGKGKSKIVFATRITQQETGQMSAPNHVTARSLASSDLTCRWTEIKGIVRGTAIDNNAQLLLDISTEDGMLFKAMFASNKLVESHSLVDSIVTIRGIPWPIYNFKGEIIRLQLLVSSTDDLTVIEKGPENVFSIPVSTISEVLKTGTSLNSTLR